MNFFTKIFKILQRQINKMREKQIKNQNDESVGNVMHESSNDNKKGQIQV